MPALRSGGRPVAPRLDSLDVDHLDAEGRLSFRLNNVAPNRDMNLAKLIAWLGRGVEDCDNHRLIITRLKTRRKTESSHVRDGERSSPTFEHRQSCWASIFSGIRRDNPQGHDPLRRLKTGMNRGDSGEKQYGGDSKEDSLMHGDLLQQSYTARPVSVNIVERFGLHRACRPLVQRRPSWLTCSRAQTSEFGRSKAKCEMKLVVQLAGVLISHSKGNAFHLVGCFSQ